MTFARARRGFSLMEIAVVLIILGILIAIGYASYGFFIAGSHKNEGSALLDRVAQNEQGISRDWGSYTAWPSDLGDVGNDVTLLNNTPSTGPAQVSLAVGSAGTLGMAVKDNAGVCYFRSIASLSSGAAANVPTNIPTNALCSGGVALPQGENVLTQTKSIKTSAN